MNKNPQGTYNNLSQRPKNGFNNLVLRKQEGLLALFSVNLFKSSALEIIFANIRV
jgi:hypothetical protein